MMSTAEIWVAQGTYYPDEGVEQTNDDRFATFVMQNNLQIYGGFDGTETMLSERDSKNNVTILSGDIDQNDNSGGDNSGNSVHVITNRNNSLNITSVLSGFTITAGNADAAGNLNASGGGVLNANSSPVITDCLFEANEASFGGAVFNTNSLAVFTLCQFISNTGTDQGGAISNNGSNTIISNCIFYDNTSNAGCVFNGSADPKITNCTFSENTSTAIFNPGSSPIIANCILWGNSGEIVNGGTATVTNSIIHGGFTGTGNKDQDPLFVDATNGNFRLKTCSPAINMGDNNAANSSGVIVNEDLDGNPRVFNTTIDMGAYEFQSAASEMLSTANQLITLPQTNVTDYQIDCDNIIATVEQTGANPIDGDVAAFVFIDAVVKQFNGIPYVRRHYEINPTADASTATGTVTLYFTQSEFDGFNAAPSSVLDLPTSPTDNFGKANLRVSKFSGNSINNSGEPNDYDSSTILINPDDNDIVWNADLMRWEVTFETVGFSGFFIQTEDAPLPVELLSFEASTVEQQILLTWATASELNNAGFEVQRSVDPLLKNWEVIGFVKGAGTTLEHVDYKFYDEQPLSALNYYRLKQMDISDNQSGTDSKYDYSDIRVVDFQSTDDEVIISPNPTSGILQLELTATHLFERISVYNSAGQQVTQLPIQSELLLSHLPNGWYWIQLQGEQTAPITKRVLKQ
ncbi:MAG: choice-of-anchor Q domain-containing protein [Bacteroidota bacterium]